MWTTVHIGTTSKWIKILCKDCKPMNFITEVMGILGSENVIQNENELEKASQNTQAITRRVKGIAFPKTQIEVQKIVELANQFKVPLYPISTGKNMGYGCMTPVLEDQFILNLSRMNQIIDYDPVVGEITVEPGVTQRQLSDFLISKGDEFWADVTGASPDASILGNTLESGFGHTPLGDHRKNIINMEVVLGSGAVLNCGEFPGLGPNASGLFIQSNFGIVTKLRIPLFKATDTLTYIVLFKNDQKFFAATEVLRELNHNGTISSLVHMGNATRTFMTVSQFPKHLDKSVVLSSADCMALLAKMPGPKGGIWNAIGGLYGTNKEINQKFKIIKKRLSPYGKVKGLSEKKMNLLGTILNLPGLMKFSFLKEAKRSLEALKHLHGLVKGRPTNMPNENIFWRKDQLEDIGLIWYCPVIPATAKDVSNLNEICTTLFNKYKFEFPLTLTLINHKDMIAVISINFDKSSEEETKRAHAAHQALSSALEGQGYYPYRTGLLGIQNKNLFPSDKQLILETLKKALDPNNIISPGRYGIGQ